MTEIWPGSRLSLGGETAAGVLNLGAPDPFVLAFLLASALALILFYSRLVSAIGASSSFFRGAYSTMETLGNNYLCNCITTTLVLMIPFYAAALRRASLGPGYWQVLATVCGLALLRKGVLALLSWLKGSPGLQKNVERVGHGVFVMVALASFLPVPVLLMFPPQVITPYRIYLAIIALIGFVVYAKRSFEWISSTGFSSFFWVLYLCTLEILPVCVAVNFLLNGN